MQNFDYYNPTQIVFGKDRLSELDNLVPVDAKILITYGANSVKKYGTLSKVIESLKGREIVEFGGIEPNPKYETLMKAVSVVKNEKIDFLLAVGGGSVMDGTKFISIASEFEGDPTTILHHGFEPVPAKKTIPLATVVTLPATGSEMNCYGVVSFNGGKFVFYSPLTFPKFSILDPTLTFTLPKKQIANGIADTFIHTVEQYVTQPVDARFQDRTAEGILKTLIEIGVKTIENPEDYGTRANFMWCATNALNGLIGAGVPQDWTTHLIGHELTAFFGIDHGTTLAILQPSVWKHTKDQKKGKLLQYADRIWGLTEGEPEDIIEEAINKTRNFFETLGINTKLNSYGVKSEDIDGVINALRQKGLTALSETGEVSLDVSRKILEDAVG
ncbi:MAG: iron-containing alcohol dehydrogenase [Deltaproteobacteria bacterium]|nr:iron-containing alcohol dehydrogenase [Deltaproteobacteria bacterium]